MLLVGRLVWHKYFGSLSLGSFEFLLEDPLKRIGILLLGSVESAAPAVCVSRC